MRKKTATDLPTKRPPVLPTERPPETPTSEQERPKGISFEDRPGRPLPFLARWREAGGQKKARAFADAESRDAFAATWAKRREAWGKAVPVLHPRDVDTWKAFAELTGGADPLMVARFWVAHRTDRGGEMIVAEAAKRVLAQCEAAGAEGDTASHLRLHLGRLTEAMGTKRLADVRPDDLRAWLAGLRDPDTGEPMEPYTQRHHLRTARLLFSTAVREKWASDDPSDGVKPPKVEPTDICVLPIEDAERLFKINRDALCVGRLALEAFGGLRYTSAARIHRAEILDAEKGIVMPGMKHKSKLRHYVDGYPDNLWQWIAHAHPAGWDVSQRNYLNLKAKMFADACVNNPGNVLRHSFCSYHVSLHKDAARTAVLLTHRSPAMLYQHYRGRATAADAARYFAIAP